VAVAGVAADPKAPARLPQKKFGRTGVSVPAIGLGTAPTGSLPQADAVALFHACLDAGVTYLDTAPSLGGYGDAQKFLAPVLKDRRAEAFVVTKCFEPDGEKALALLKSNLRELGIDRADLVYAHSIGADEMPPDRVFGRGGVCEALTKAKKDGLTRFVGASGHNRPGRFLKALEAWEYDVQMNAVSLVARHVYDFEGKVWPAAAKKGIGLAAMKVFGGAAGGKDWAARVPAELRPAAFRYALGLPDVAVVVLGMSSRDELKQNLEWLKGYKPLTKDELAALDGPTRELAKKWGSLYGAVS
jgi:aryl-alcohol dehydrogenase-like predicted oxidoreductase